MRIRGELLKLGVARLRHHHRHRASPERPRSGASTGRTSTQFLRLQAFAILSGDPRTDEDDRFEDLAHNPMGSARDAKTQRPGDDDGLLQLDDEAGCSAPRLVRYEERAPNVEKVQSHETVAASRPPLLGARPRDRPEPPLDLGPYAGAAHERAGLLYGHAA